MPILPPPSSGYSAACCQGVGQGGGGAQGRWAQGRVAGVVAVGPEEDGQLRCPRRDHRHQRGAAGEGHKRRDAIGVQPATLNLPGQQRQGEGRHLWGKIWHGFVDLKSNIKTRFFLRESPACPPTGEGQRDPAGLRGSHHPQETGQHVRHWWEGEQVTIGPGGGSGGGVEGGGRISAAHQGFWIKFFSLLMSENVSLCSSRQQAEGWSVQHSNSRDETSGTIHEPQNLNVPVSSDSNNDNNNNEF